MKIRIICIGKTDEDYVLEGIRKYLKRLKHYISLDYIELPDLKNKGKIEVDRLKEEEGRILLSKISDKDHLVLLDEIGKEFTSLQFSAFLQKKMIAANDVVFVIGGAFGFDQSVYDRQNEKIALSKMTFSHQMVRLFFVEQLYRGFSILKGEKYHHQ
ncbi:MAG TPA: 23S rRNA (pseudouridine(1915)-N(3))-methyltransferase RlmH [Cytophagaceae bacterium]|jgi:23S rRNA (pseudouridine1915-N3)-methyltransferase